MELCFKIVPGMGGSGVGSALLNALFAEGRGTNGIIGAWPAHTVPWSSTATKHAEDRNARGTHGHNVTVTYWSLQASLPHPESVGVMDNLHYP